MEPAVWNVDTTSFAYKFMINADVFYAICIVLLIMSIVLLICHSLDSSNGRDPLLSGSWPKMLIAIFMTSACALLFCPSQETMVFRYVSKVIDDNKITNMNYTTVRGILEEHRIINTIKALELVAPHRIKVRKEDDNSIIIKEGSKDLNW